MKLTRSEVETIRIHMNAFKEKLCNQGRWNEAQEYQDIVDKLDELLTAESVIRCKDCRWHWRVTESRVSGYCENDKCFDGFHFETNNDFYCGYAERKEE